jgi:hypothetical protein
MNSNRDKTEYSVGRRKIMLTLHHTLRRKCRIVFLVGTVLGGLLSSPPAFAADTVRYKLRGSEAGFLLPQGEAQDEGKKEEYTSFAPLTLALSQREREFSKLTSIPPKFVPNPTAVAAERERVVLFLSVEDLQLVVSHPSSFSLPTYRRLAPSLEWQAQTKAAAQAGPVALRLRWDTGLGTDSYTHLRTRPLWGY